MNPCVHHEGGFIVSASTIERAAMLTGRQLMLGVVVALHVLVISALMTMQMTSNDKPPQTAFKPITRIEPPKPMPPEERPQLPVDVPVISWQPPPIPVPTIEHPEIQWIAPDTTPPVQLGTRVVEDAAPGDPAPIASTELSYRATRSPDDYYPAVSLQLQEQGSAVVRVCVGASGRREGPPTIERSSGSRRLDAAAVLWAREALDFTPATRNGAAVAACKGFRVNFQLR
jgi:protein TonB